MIGIKSYSPNLLINGDFQVWQRGEIFTESGYSADRWYLSLYNSTVSKSNEYMHINCINGNAVSIQHIEKNLTSKTLTMSFEYIENEQTKKVIHTFDSVSSTPSIIDIGDNVKISLYYDTDKKATTYWIRFDNKNVYLKWCKLEQGSIATPFVPRQYGLELLLCQRYYTVFGTSEILGFAEVRSSTHAYIIISLPTQMRIDPTFAGTIRLYQSGGVYASSTNLDRLMIGNKNICLVITTSGLKDTNNSAICYSQTPIIFDAEI